MSWTLYKRLLKVSNFLAFRKGKIKSLYAIAVGVKSKSLGKLPYYCMHSSKFFKTKLLKLNGFHSWIIYSCLDHLYLSFWANIDIIQHWLRITFNGHMLWMCHSHNPLRHYDKWFSRNHITFIFPQNDRTSET